MPKKSAPDGATTYLRLLKYVRRYWLAFLVSILGLMLHSFAEIAFVDLLGFITDTVANLTSTSGSVSAQSLPTTGITAMLSKGLLGGLMDDRAWLVIPIFLIVISVLRGIGYLIGSYGLAYVSNYLVHELRLDIFEKYLQLPFGFFDRSMSGRLVSVVTYNVQQVTQACTKALKTLLQQGSLVIGLLGYLVYINWKLTLFFVAVMPLVAILVSVVSRRFRLISTRIQSAMGDVTHVTQEAVNGYQEVRMFGAVTNARERMALASHSNRRQNMKMSLTEGVSSPLVMLLVSSAFGGITGFMLSPSILETMSTGSFITFLVASGMLIKPIRQIAEINSDIQKGIAAAESIFEILDDDPERDNGDVELDSVRGEFHFKAINFQYNADGPMILQDINFSVKSGETVALVGTSGSGKTTLVSLIARFYNHGEGNIFLDGVDVNDYTLKNLRSHIAQVSQNVTLFNDTIFNNIAYGELSDSSLEDVKAAAAIAHADIFIEQLSDGYQTHIGDDGVMLSGGQRQRIAIARAVLKNAPVLILDEATSALDTDSERYIQAALEELMKSRTTFVIAHRLSTVEKADRILVMEKGRIVEQGSHQELLDKVGRYSQLYHNQFSEQEAG